MKSRNIKTHKMRLQADYFNEMCGTKKSEFRLYDEKRKEVNLGDFIEFGAVNPERCDNKEVRRVVGIQIAKNFQELTENIAGKWLMGQDRAELAIELSDIYGLRLTEQWAVGGAVAFLLEAV